MMTEDSDPDDLSVPRTLLPELGNQAGITHQDDDESEQSHTVSNTNGKIGLGVALLPAYQITDVQAQTEAGAMDCTVNPNSGYRGRPTRFRNQPHSWMDEDRNCSFWITHLPRNVTINMLLGEIRNVPNGRIYASNIQLDVSLEHKGVTDYAAAKVVFIAVEAAQYFWNHYAEDQSLIVGGLRAKIRRNRVLASHNHRLPRRCSRVVVIEGPRHIVNTPTLTEAFQEAGFYYDLDCIIVHEVTDTQRRVEWRFAAWQFQAELAVYHLVHSEPFRGQVRVRYGYDPCDHFGTRPPVLIWESEETVLDRTRQLYGTL